MTSETAQRLGAVGAAPRAELLRLGRWPTLWVLVGVWTLLQVTFSFAFPYLAYRSGDPDAFQGGPDGELLASMLPDAVPVMVVQGTPMFGGAVVLILGALAAGSGYGWGTWKTVMTQRPGRGAAMAGTVTAVAVCVAALLTLTVVVDLGLACLVAAVESQPVGLPDLAELGRGVGAAGLVLAMWSAAGLFLGAATRGPALSVGLGLVWTLVVENLLRGAARLVDWLQPVTDHLPGTASGSLAGALGAADGPDATPGVSTVLDGTAAAVTTGAYLVVFVVTTLLLVRHRDLS